MKKKFFLVGALVAMSVSAMFVACSQKNEPATTTITGCDCTIYDQDGDVYTQYIDYSHMKSYYGANTCSELTQAMKNLAGSDIRGANCK